MKLDDFHIAGSIGEPADPKAAAIAARLHAQPAIDLAHGALFTGKSQTRIHADEAHVLKYRLDRRFDQPDIALQWARKRLETERARGIFHPGRTWLVLPTPEGRGVLTGNLTPRLTPLHVLDWQGIEAPERILGEVCAIYCRHLAQAEARLDEGLSNFGLDADGRIYYLDDDFYPWDEHHAFAAMIAQWLRQFAGAWLDDAHAHRLGKAIGDALRPLPRIEADLLKQALRDIFLGEAADARRRWLLDGMAASLRPPAAATAATDPLPVPPDWTRPVGLIADIHANLPALEAVDAAMRAQGVSQYFCLGDIVGYGPDPAACIEWIRSRRVFSIRGNH
ncbi:MAG: metallophosphoesterase family protein, partial [Mariprofundaceae bacterium]